MANQQQTFPNGPAFKQFGYKAQLKLFVVDDTVTPSQPGWILLGDIGSGPITAALQAALPASTKLLAGTGTAGGAQEATTAHLVDLFEAWVRTLGRDRPAVSGFYLNGDFLSYRKAGFP